MSYVLDNPLPMVPPRGSSTGSRHAAHSREVSYLILSSMCDDVPREFRAEIEYLSGFDMIEAIKKRYQSRCITCYDMIRQLCRPIEFEMSMRVHVDRMERCVNTLNELDSPLHPDMAIDMILATLPSEYTDFVLGYNKDVFGGSISQLRDLLIAEEMRLKGQQHIQSGLGDASEVGPLGMLLCSYPIQIYYCRDTNGNVFITFMICRDWE